MRPSLFTALRTCIVLAALGSLLGQVAVIPQVAAEEALAWPEVAHLRWPYTAAAVAVVACVQVALVATWALLDETECGEVFDGRAFARVDAIIAAAAVATTLSAGVAAHLLVVVGVGGPGVALGLGAAVVGGTTFALLMTVMRGLLRRATSMRGELAEIV